MWATNLKKEIINHGFDLGIFSFQEFYNVTSDVIQTKYPNNHTLKASYYRTLQILRDENYLLFLDNKGMYQVNSRENEEWNLFVNQYHNNI
jgi:hypothetical protein